MESPQLSLQGLQQLPQLKAPEEQASCWSRPWSCPWSAECLVWKCSLFKSLQLPLAQGRLVSQMPMSS